LFELPERHATGSHQRESIIRSKEAYESWHFAEATRVGDTVWVSGQVGYDLQGEISADPREQARVAFENLAETLRIAGADLRDIVELKTYHADMADIDGFRSAKDHVITAPYPSWTVIGVQSLAVPAIRVEICAVAIVGSGRSATTLGAGIRTRSGENHSSDDADAGQADAR